MEMVTISKDEYERLKEIERLRVEEEASQAAKDYKKGRTVPYEFQS